MKTALKRSPENAYAILRDLSSHGKKIRRNQNHSRRQANLRSRFGTDERTYSEKNLRWRNLAEYGSYLGQMISVAGAGYSVIKLIYEPSPGGWIATFLFVAALLVFEAIQRWTSDEFWDRKEAGDFSLKYAFLNFVVIWGMSAMLTLGGIFFLSKDTQSDPMMYSDPQVASIRSQIEKLEAENTDYKTNPKYEVSGGKDKGEIRWEFQQAIGSNTRQIEELNASLTKRFGVTAMIDIEALEYHKLVGESRMWLYVGLSFLCLILFEVCMWYRSKYDRIKYTEDVLAGEVEDQGFLAYLQGK